MRCQAEAVRKDFQRLLIAGGVLAGYASFDVPDRVQLLLHPRDQRTGIRYSALAMVHAIIDELFTPEQAAAHAALIEAELTGPDGLRLFDRPLDYRGGTMQLFQRGESASYFGREIGLMYMHAHLRWAEALAQLGRGEALLHALRLANPIGLEALVPSAAPRQRNCYYSSSDAAFADRYEAQAHYAQVKSGGVALEGGWRVYSSGAGIAWRIVVQRLLGLVTETHRLGIDPVLPPALDGLEVVLPLNGVALRVRYRVGPRGHGPVALRLNRQLLTFERGVNRYRAPGVWVAIDHWRAALRPDDNRLEITIG
jgi:cellobiose phosphorylase